LYYIILYISYHVYHIIIFRYVAASSLVYVHDHNRQFYNTYVLSYCTNKIAVCRKAPQK